MAPIQSSPRPGSVTPVSAGDQHEQKIKSKSRQQGDDGLPEKPTRVGAQTLAEAVDRFEERLRRKADQGRVRPVSEHSRNPPSNHEQQSTTVSNSTNGSRKESERSSKKLPTERPSGSRKEKLRQSMPAKLNNSLNASTKSKRNRFIRETHTLSKSLNHRTPLALTAKGPKPKTRRELLDERLERKKFDFVSPDVIIAAMEQSSGSVSSLDDKIQLKKMHSGKGDTPKGSCRYCSCSDIIGSSCSSRSSISCQTCGAHYAASRSRNNSPSHNSKKEKREPSIVRSSKNQPSDNDRTSSSAGSHAPPERRSVESWDDLEDVLEMVASESVIHTSNGNISDEFGCRNDHHMTFQKLYGLSTRANPRRVPSDVNSSLTIKDLASLSTFDSPRSESKSVDSWGDLEDVLAEATTRSVTNPNALYECTSDNP